MWPLSFTEQRIYELYVYAGKLIPSGPNFPVLTLIDLDLLQTERTIAAPGPGEAQVAVKATGLCGSDLHYYIQYVVSPFDRRFSDNSHITVVGMVNMFFATLWLLVCR